MQHILSDGATDSKVIFFPCTLPSELIGTRNRFGMNNMSFYDRKCPACGNVISPPEVPESQPNGFLCPFCGRRLKTSLVNLRLSWSVTLIIAISLCFYFGLRGVTAIAISLVVSFPLSFLVDALLAIIFPPPFRLLPSDHDPASKN